MKRLFVWTLALAAVVAVVLTAVYLLRGVVIAPRLQAFLAETVESQLGVRISVGGIGGSYLESFEITGVETLEAGTTGPLVSVELERVRLEYSLLGLLGGIDAFLAKTEVELVGAKVEIDLTQGALEEPEEPEPAGPLFLPAALPRVNLRETSVFVRGEGFQLDLVGVDLQVSSRAATATPIQLRVENMHWLHPNLREGTTSLAADFAYSEDAFVVDRVALGGDTVIDAARFDLSGLPNAITFDSSLQLFGGPVELAGGFRETSLSARWQIQSFSLDAFSSLVIIPDLTLGGDLDSSARVQLDTTRLDELSGDLTLQLTGGTVQGIAADLLHLEAAAGEGMLRVERLDARSGENHASLNAVAAPSKAVFEGDVDRLIGESTAAFSIDLQDIPSLLKMFAAEGPTAAVEIPPHRLTLEGQLRGGTVTVSEGRLATDTGSVLLERAEVALPFAGRTAAEAPIGAALKLDLPDLAPLAALFTLPPLRGSIRGDAEIEGTLETPLGSIAIDARDLAFRQIPVGSVKLAAQADARRVAVDSLELLRGKDRVSGHGSFAFSSQELDDVSVDILIRDLRAYEELIPSEMTIAGQPLRLGGRVTGRLTAKGSLQAPRGTVTVEAKGVVFQGNAVGDLTLSGKADPKRVHIDSLELRNGKDRITGRGSYDIETLQLDDVSLDVLLRDVGVYTVGLLPEGSEITGGLRLGLRASGPLEEPEADLDIAIDGARAAGVDVSEASVKARSSGRKIEIDRIAAQTSEGDVSLAGELTRGPTDASFDLQLNELALAREGTTLKLDSPARVSIATEGVYQVNGLSLSGAVGAIRVDGSLAPQGSSDFTVEISDLTGKGWLEQFVEDLVFFEGADLKLHVSGPLTAPEVTAAGSVASIGHKDAPFPLAGAFDLAYNGEGIRVARFDWSAEGGQRLSLQGEIPLNPLAEDWFLDDEISLTARLEIPDLTALGPLVPPEIRSGGSINGELELAGAWDDPTGRFHLDVQGLSLPESLKPAPPGPLSVNCEVEARDNVVTLKQLQVDSPDVLLRADGRWSQAPPLTDLLRGKEFALAGDVSLRGELDIPDLSWVADGVEGVRRMAGKLRGEISIEGPIQDPRFEGALHLTEGELRPAAAAPSVRALTLDATVNTTGVRIDPLRGELGGSPFELSGSLEREDPEGARVDLTLSGENLLLFRSDGVKLRADTDLTIKGPVAKLAITGTVAITDGRFVKNIDFLGPLRGSGKPRAGGGGGLQLFSFPDPPLRDAVFDVGISAKSPFRIKNNVALGAVRPELRLTGTGELPAVVGEVYVDSIRVKLPAGRLTFRSGVIRFLPSDPDRPRLDLLGTTKMMDYDVNVLVEGPFDEPVVTLSSSPPLPDDELLLMVLTGQPPKAAARGGASMNVAVYLGKGMLARWFGNESTESDESVLDRFDVQIGRGVTRTGDETIEAEFRLAEGLIQERDTLYLTGEKDVFDAFNAGVKIVFRFK